jgi:tetratricopeptide (TPR) repeat protein
LAGVANERFAQGDLNSCRALLKGALETAPENLELLATLGSITFQLREYQEARRCFERAVELDPGSPMFHVQLGAACLQLQDMPAFERALQRALDLDGECVEALALLANLNLQIGQFHPAAELYQRVLAGKGDDTGTLLALAKCQFHLGNQAEAGRLYEQVRQLDPRNAVAAEALQMLRARGNGKPKPATANVQPPASQAGLAAYGRVEGPRTLNADHAGQVFGRLGTNPETTEYHRNHLNRYLVTLERVRHLPRSTRVLEVGAPPFGLAILMRELLFDQVEVSGFAESDRERAAKVYRERVVIGRPEPGQGHVFDMQCFNLETHQWPYEAESFDLVVACEVFEHLCLDPMAAVAQANRVLRRGGYFLITAPNAVSISNLARLVAGQQPNSFPFYRPRSECMRNNRELTPGDLEALFKAGGFGIETLETWNSSAPSPIAPALLERMHSLLGDFRLRDEVLVGLGRKTGPVCCRYPLDAELYYEWDVKANRV